MFHLKQPCKDCPFVKGSTTNLVLSSERFENIVSSLHSDQVFRCHKTLDYSKEDENGHIPYEERNQFCAGAMVYLDKCDKHNAPMQIGIRLGMLDPTDLKGHDQVIDPLPISNYGAFFPHYRLQKNHDV